MSTKTISLSLPAYKRLCLARQRPAESFSQVVLRAEWRGDTITAEELLRSVHETGACYSDKDLDVVADAKRAVKPPVDKWQNG